MASALHGIVRYRTVSHDSIGTAWHRPATRHRTSTHSIAHHRIASHDLARRRTASSRAAHITHGMASPPGHRMVPHSSTQHQIAVFAPHRLVVTSASYGIARDRKALHSIAQWCSISYDGFGISRYLKALAPARMPSPCRGVIIVPGRKTPASHGTARSRMALHSIAQRSTTAAPQRPCKASAPPGVAQHRTASHSVSKGIGTTRDREASRSIAQHQHHTALAARVGLWNAVGGWKRNEQIR